MRPLYTSAIAILAAGGFVLSSSAEQADEQAAQQQVANGQCELEFAEVDDRVAQDDELRAQVTSGVLRDLRRMRNAAITLEQYGESRACQEVVVAIHEILEQPEQFGIAEAPEDDAELDDATEEDPELAEAPAEEVEDPEATAAVPQEDQEAAMADEPAEQEELTWQQQVETDREAAVGLADMDAQMRLNELIGTDVRDSQGEHIGDVNDLMIGAEGEPDYIIISHGGFLGIGDDMIPVPFDQVRVSPDLDAVYLPISAAELEQAPRVARGDDVWFQDRDQQEETAEFYQRD